MNKLLLSTQKWRPSTRAYLFSLAALIVSFSDIPYNADLLSILLRLTFSLAGIVGTLEFFIGVFRSYKETKESNQAYVNFEKKSWFRSIKVVSYLLFFLGLGVVNYLVSEVFDFSEALFAFIICYIFLMRFLKKIVFYVIMGSSEHEKIF